MEGEQSIAVSQKLNEGGVGLFNNSVDKYFAAPASFFRGTYSTALRPRSMGCSMTMFLLLLLFLLDPARVVTLFLASL